VWSFNPRSPIATPLTGGLLLYLSWCSAMGTGPPRRTVATERAALAVHWNSQVLMVIPLLLMVLCHAGFAGAEICNATRLAALPWCLRTCSGTPSILTPSPSCVSPRLCSMRPLGISCGASVLDNTLIRGVGVELSLQKPKSSLWVSQRETHYRTRYRRGRGYLSHHMAPASHQTAFQRLV